MVQGTTPTLLFKFSVDLDLIKEWRICFYQEGEENLVKTEEDCVVDENKVIYVKLTQEETFAFDDKKVLKIKCKALTQDGNVIPSQAIKMFVCEMQDKVLFDVENIPPQIIDTSTINFEFETEPCGFGLDFEELYIEQVGTGGGGGNITVDSQLSTTSKNPVQNKVITNRINEFYNEFDTHKKKYEGVVDGFDKVQASHAQRIESLEKSKQDKLTFDEYPTENSKNPVTSSGVEKAIQDLAQAQNTYLENTLTQFEQDMDNKHASKEDLQAIDEHISNYEGKVDENIDRLNDLDSDVEIINTQIGDIETALDSIISIQNSLIGGGN